MASVNMQLYKQSTTSGMNQMREVISARQLIPKMKKYI